MESAKITEQGFVNKLVNTYFLKNPVFKIYIVPILLIIYLSAQCHGLIIESVTNMENYIIGNLDKGGPGKLIGHYIFYVFMHYALTFLSECLFAVFLQNTVVSSFKIHVNEYIMLCHNDYHKLGSGKIHSLIERRTKGIVDFIDLIIMNGYFNFIFIFVVLSKMAKNHSKILIMFNVAVIIFYMVFTYFSSFIIKKKREVANNEWNECSNRIYGILNNYDVIKSYNNDTLEISKLNEKCLAVERSYFMFDTVCNITSFIQALIPLLPNNFVIYFVLTGKGFSSLSSFYLLSLYHKQSASLRINLENFGKQILTFVQTYTDVTDSHIGGKQLDNYKKDNDIVSFNKHIEFRDFSLYIKNIKLIDKFNFTLKKGDKIAIVGKNGSGKSSLIKTLLRFYEYEGDVFIDDMNMKDVPVTSQREFISYIPQNPYIIEGTVLDNLKYANKKLNNKEIKELCIMYDTHSIFAKLKDGYMTNVGESGKFLSGGQKQQLSFMRGVLKNADIFLVDEPTANLDKRAENKLINNMFANLSEKTIIFVIHNFDYLQQFDKIIGFNDQKITVYHNYADFKKDSHLY